MIQKLLLFVGSMLVLGCSIQKSSSQKEIQDIHRYIQHQLSKDNSEEKYIQIPKGVYHFYESTAQRIELYISNHDQSNPKNVGIYLDNLEDVTIDGSGSEFIFHGRMLPIVLENSKNITFKNFSIDFALPQIRQIEILRLDSAKDESIAHIYPSGNYTIDDGKITFTDSTYTLSPTWSMPFRPDGRLAYKRADVAFDPSYIEEVGPDTIRISGWKQHAETEIGERFALRTYNRPTPGIFLNQNKDTKIQNVTVHYSEGMGLLAQMSENIHLDGFNVALRKGDKRYFTAQADATHFSGCKGVILSENGLYEGMADDAINVHGTYLRVIQRIGDHTLRAKYMHSQSWGFLWGEVGDSVQIIESDKMQLVDNSIYKIASIKANDKPSEFGAKVFDITFDQKLPAEVNEEGEFGLENLTWSPEVIFRNNVVRNNRARGSLFSTPRRVVCEENLFDHTHGTAILLSGDSNGWYETGACRDVIIRNNTFVNALTAYYQFTNAVISIYPEIPNLEEQDQFFHSNIVIENNVFDTFDKPLLYAKSTDGLTFTKNTVKTNTEFKPFHHNKFPFFFEKVNRVKIEDNKFDKGFDIQKDVRIDFSGKEAVEAKNNTR